MTKTIRHATAVAPEPAPPAVRPNALHRAVADLRRGDAILLRDGDAEAAIVLAAEAVEDEWLAKAAGVASLRPSVAVTRRRAIALDLAPPDGAVVELCLSGPLTGAALQDIADPTRPAAAAPVVLSAQLNALSPVAVKLMKLARLLPAAILFPVEPARSHALAEQFGLIELSSETVLASGAAEGQPLRIVADARVPLADAEAARIIAFRPDDGGTDHLAIVVGDPPKDQPVLMRIHSECFTGDLLASLRCDCGEQLRGAIRAVAANPTGGIVIYLAQEGRGIGLINKLRAYRLQDAGYDTIAANEELGFEADERVYQPAAEILRQLGYGSARLLTNNPDKVAALAAHGVEVVERVPHAFAPNDHNRAYLDTKRLRAGHLF